MALQLPPEGNSFESLYPLPPHIGVALTLASGHVPFSEWERSPMSKIQVLSLGKDLKSSQKGTSDSLTSGSRRST